MSEGDKVESGKGSLNIELGKEIDRSLAEIMTALLKPAATEIGAFLGDSMGFIADRIRRKRERNAQLGLDEVRKKLEASNIDMNEITPPNEEELHLLLTGLSLSDDPNIRGLWAGLFAKALDPKSTTTAERHYLAVLQTLSATDSKVIDFLAFAIRTDEDFRAKLKNFQPQDFATISPEEKEKMEEVRAGNWELRKKTVKTIRQRAEEYGLDLLEGPGWSENLIRQQLVERSGEIQRPSNHFSFSSLDQRELMQAIDLLASHINYLQEKAELDATPPDKVLSKAGFNPEFQLDVRFTGFGRRFAAACGLL